MWLADPDPALIAAARAPFDPDRPVAVAVSGGGDSMALLHLLSCAGLTLAAVTVDHGLRQAAADEAALVAAFCAARGVPHEVLHWQGRGASGNVLHQARRARYALIADWARGRGIGQVALGHQADDVAETLLMRLTRRSGVDGLAAMAPAFEGHGVRFHRPLLAQPRQALHDHLARHGIAYADDPGNRDPARERARARAALAVLAPLGLSAEILRDAAQNLAEARAALRFAAHRLGAEAVRQQAGDLVVDPAAFAPLPAELRRRILVAAQLWINGADYPPRRDKQAVLMQAIARGRPTTLAGCRLVAGGSGLRLTRELRAVAGRRGPTDAVWDTRWRLDGPHAADLHIAALGPHGLPRCPDWRAMPLPRPSLLASPAVWRGDTLVAAPLAGLARGWSARLAEGRDDFTGFLLSH